MEKKNPKKNFYQKVEEYRFQLKHVLVLFIILIFFQVLVSFVHKVSLQDFLIETPKAYQEDFAEHVGNLTATSLELLLENAEFTSSTEKEAKIIQAFNIILSQQDLQRHVEDICLIVSNKDQDFALDGGREIYDFLVRGERSAIVTNPVHTHALELYTDLKKRIHQSEEIQIIFENNEVFHVFVPFVPKGEFSGVVYMRNKPNFGLITNEIVTSYNEASLIFTALIFFGLLAMFYISSYTVQERDATQELLYQEKETQLKERINYQKEAQFTKRIYHTHHKAEKVMGFIKEDVRALSEETIDVVKYRITKYANFISRVIYDMKWYDPPLQAIRNPIFQTNLNEVVKFIVEHIILRVARDSQLFKFKLDFDDTLPRVPINEFVAWEVIEPLLQNSIDHNSDTGATISVISHFDAKTRTSTLRIRDTGKGISAELLKVDKSGIKRIFQENISTKQNPEKSGYGCYLAYEIAHQRCNWQMDVKNLSPGGCEFIITIQN